MRSIHYLLAAGLLSAASVASAQAPELQAMDLMPMADTDQDGKVTLEEYTAFSAQGWDFVSQGADKVKLADLDPQAQLAFFGIEPDADGVVTRQMFSTRSPPATSCSMRIRTARSMPMS